MAPASQPLFAFEWENPHTGTKEQLNWTRLPQGFKNSPTLFSGTLAADLAEFPGQKLGCVLLHYVDDLLLAGTMDAQCLEGTRALLSLLMEASYRVSKKKAQICKKQVKYLGFNICRAEECWGPKESRQFVPFLSLPPAGRFVSS